MYQKNIINFILLAVVLIVVSSCTDKKPISNQKVINPGDEKKGVDVATSTDGLMDEVDTSDWQIYRDETVGFEIMFPKNWDAPEGWQDVIQIDTVDELDNINSDYVIYLKDFFIENLGINAKINIVYSIVNSTDYDIIINNIFYQADLNIGDNRIRLSIILPREENYYLPKDQVKLDNFIKSIKDGNGGQKINKMIDEFNIMLTNLRLLEQ